MPPLDAFAGLLSELAEAGRAPKSRLGAVARRRLDSLFAAGALREARSGAGMVVVVDKPEVLTAFAARCYPNGLVAAQPDAAGPRTASLAAFGDTKATGRGLDHEIVLMRAFGECNVSAQGRPVDAVGITGLTGCVALILGDIERPSIQGKIALVEGPELFLNFERAGIRADAAILYNGRMSERMLRWLGSTEMTNAGYLHCPDYDPVGLDEFCRAEKSLGGRVSLFIPGNIEQMFASSRNKKLIEDNAAIKYRLASVNHTGVQRILGLMDCYGCGLEQESLLLDKNEGRGIWMDAEYNQLLAKARAAKQGGRDAWAVQSTGEKLAVAMVLNRHDWLVEMNYSIGEAITRVGAEWVALVPRVERALRDEAVS